MSIYGPIRGGGAAGGTNAATKEYADAKDAATKAYMDAQDAAMKAYVDTLGNLRILKAGDSMTGPLAWAGTWCQVYPRHICCCTLVMRQHRGVRRWGLSQTRPAFLSKRKATP